MNITYTLEWNSNSPNIIELGTHERLVCRSYSFLLKSIFDTKNKLTKNNVL